MHPWKAVLVYSGSYKEGGHFVDFHNCSLFNELKPISYYPQIIHVIVTEGGRSKSQHSLYPTIFKQRIPQKNIKHLLPCPSYFNSMNVAGVFSTLSRPSKCQNAIEGFFRSSEAMYQITACLRHINNPAPSQIGTRS